MLGSLTQQRHRANRVGVEDVTVCVCVRARTSHARRRRRPGAQPRAALGLSLRQRFLSPPELLHSRGAARAQVSAAAVGETGRERKDGWSNCVRLDFQLIAESAPMWLRDLWRWHRPDPCSPAGLNLQGS